MSNAEPNRLDTQLLTDLRHFFTEQPATHYPTERLLDYLTSLDAAPWTTVADGKPITARHLARLLQPYSIAPKTIRFANGLAKGYRAADFNSVVTDKVADIVDVTDRIESAKVDVTDKTPVLADSVVTDSVVTDKVADIVDVTDNVTDKKELVADNVLDATRHQLYRLGESLARGYEATGNPFSHANPSEIQHWRDLADLMRKAAESIDSFTATTRPTLTLIQGGASTVADNVADNVADIAQYNVADKNVAATVADNVVTMTRAAITTTDNLAASVPASPTQKWPPPKGWAWNHQTGDYEPPKPTLQPEPMDQETIRQTLKVDPSLKYIPGYGLHTT